MEYRFHKKKDRLVVVLNGDFDLYSAFTLKKKILAELQKKSIDIELECSDVNYIDSSGIGLILQILNHQNEKENKLFLKNVSEEILKIFKAIKLDKTLAGCFINDKKSSKDE